MQEMDEVLEIIAEPLQKYIAGHVENKDDAEDIRQEVFLKMLKHLHTLRDQKKLPAWMFQIARRTIADHFRRQRNATIPPEALDDLISCEPPPPMDARAEIARCLPPMLALLPEKYRHALLLADCQGLSGKELAARLGLSVSGAKSRVQRGRGKLKKMLLDCCRLEFDSRGRIMDYVPGRNAGRYCSIASIRK